MRFDCSSGEVDLLLIYGKSVAGVYWGGHLISIQLVLYMVSQLSHDIAKIA